MAWRNARYCILHAAREVGAAGISTGSTFSTTQPKDHLIDNRAGSLTTFTATSSTHYIQIDRGAGATAINRLWIPAGHNFAGWDIRLRADDDVAMGSATLLIDPAGDGLSVGSGAIDIDFTSNTERYVRLDWPNETTINPALGELLLTITRTLTTGPEPGWTDELTPNTRLQELRGGGQAALVEGADQRSFELRYRAVSDTTDLALFDDLVALGLSAPLLFDPPYDDEASVWCRLQEGIRRVQDPQVPATSNARQTQIDVRLLEHVL